MPSTFEATFSTDAVPNLFDLFGEDVTYTPSGGVAKTIKGIVARREFSEARADDGTERVRESEVRIRDDATLGVVSPALNDKIAFDSLTWGVRAIDPKQTGVHVLRVVEIVVAEKSSRTYRLER